MLDFRVNTFLTVCETKNYTKAAEKLGLTQPAVTQHIKYIEEMYNVRLFFKEGKNMCITPEGELLRDMLITLRADCAKIERRLKSVSEKTGSIKMGATKAFGEYVLPSIIEKYMDSVAETKLVVQVENIESLLYMLQKGSLDFVFAEGQFEKNRYNCKTLGKYKVVCISSSKNPLNEKADIEDLFKNRLIVREKGSGTRDMFEQKLEHFGYDFGDFKSVVEVGSVDVIKKMVEDDYGITFIPEKVVKNEIDMGVIKKIDISDFEIISEVNFITLKNTMFIKDFEHFFDFANKDIF